MLFVAFNLSFLLCYYLNFDDRTKFCILNCEPSLLSKCKTSEKSGKKSERSETVDKTFLSSKISL